MAATNASADAAIDAADAAMPAGVQLQQVVSKLSSKVAGIP